MEKTSTLLKKLEAANKLINDQKYALDKAAIVAVTDRRGLITYVNEKFCAISGYTDSELLGKTHQMVNSGLHPRSFFTQMWRVISSGRVWNGEICNRAKDGSLYWVDTTIVPFLDKNQIPYQYIAIRNDISHRKSAEAALEKARAKSASSEKMASLGILSSGIAHDLGNPLGALRGRAEMLERYSEQQQTIESTKVNDISQKMIGLIDRMSKIIRGLRAYARDGSQDPFATVDVGALVGDILEISKDRCRRHGIEVSLQSEVGEFFCWGREAEIGQVIVNLLNNAIDACRLSSEKWVKLELAKPSQNTIRIVVVDSGTGITPESRDKIFDPFYTTKAAGKGTGLGLSISKSIVDAHDGHLITSVEDGHTCFEVTLPARAAKS